jgi:hypothetical protein
VSRFEYDSPTKIATIMQKAADANFNVVYFQVRGSGDAYYRSSLEPCSVGLCGHLGGTPTWDPLAVAVQEAHSRGLQLHAWLNAFTGWGSGASTTCALLKESDPGNPRHMLLAHPEWKVVDNAGVTHPCPNRRSTSTCRRARRARARTWRAWRPTWRGATTWTACTWTASACRGPSGRTTARASPPSARTRRRIPRTGPTSAARSSTWR